MAWLQLRCRKGKKTTWQYALGAGIATLDGQIEHTRYSDTLHRNSTMSTSVPEDNMHKSLRLSNPQLWLSPKFLKPERYMHVDCTYIHNMSRNTCMHTRKSLVCSKSLPDRAGNVPKCDKQHRMLLIVTLPVSVEHEPKWKHVKSKKAKQIDMNTAKHAFMNATMGDRTEPLLEAGACFPPAPQASWMLIWQQGH